MSQAGGNAPEVERSLIPWTKEGESTGHKPWDQRGRGNQTAQDLKGQVKDSNLDPKSKGSPQRVLKQNHAMTKFSFYEGNYRCTAKKATEGGQSGWGRVV